MNQLEKYPAYKDSGVAWLGEIPAGWEVKPLCAVSKLKSIANCPDLQLLSVYLDKGVIKFSDVTEKRTNGTSEDLSKYQLVEPGDFVLNNQQAWRGSVGVSAFRGIVSPAYIILTLSKIINHDYSRYLFRSPVMVSQYLVSSKGVGTIQRNLYYPQLKRASVPLPPLPEQTAIATFLDEKTAKIDTAIAQKEQMIALLTERKQILIQNAVTKGINPAATMKDSGVEWIGEIPEEWEVKRLKFLFNEINERTKTGREVLFSLRMEQGLVPHNDVSDKHIAEENLIDYKIVQPGQMVMNRMRAAIGIFGLANDYGLVSPDYAVFNVGENADPEYFLRLFKTMLIGIQFRLNSKGLGTGSSGFMRLYTENFGDIKIPLPPIEEQIATITYITTQAAKIDTSIALQLAQIAKLKEYKAILIDSAVTGKIKVC